MTPTPRRAAIYVRVSTNKQHTENQELVLREVCQRAGWGVAAVYEDKGFSGS
jgi:DNA invertase Pin-like site-specific DNA recombinase